MYPIRLGFDEVIGRIEALAANGHHAEALVTSMFTMEKTLRRSLKFCAVRRGFTSKQAKKLCKGMGFEQLKNLWPLFAPQEQSLAEFIGPL